VTESWRNLMDVGIVHFMIFPDTIKGPEQAVETVRQIAQDDFFNVLEIRRYDDPEVMKQIRAIAEQSGLRLGIGAQPPILMGKLNLNSLDEAERKAAVEDVKKSIDAAYLVGAKLTACLSGPDPGEADRPAAMDKLVESLIEICKYSQSKTDGEPVWLSLETFDDSIEKKCLIGSTSLAVEVSERVRDQAENFGLTVDLSHLPLLKETAEQCISTGIEHIIHVHAGNCIMRDPNQPGYGDQHPRFGVEGGENGVQELREYLECLLDYGYFDKELPTDRPVLTFEVKPLPGETPELVIASTKRVFREAWALV
jgi:sugar phosphate isomerase/epimerase